MRWEIEYRPRALTDEEDLLGRPWVRWGKTEEEVGSVAIDGLEDGTEYEVRARQVLDDGAFGDWLYADPARASRGSRLSRDGTEQPPPPPRNVRIDRDGCLTWDYPPGVQGLAGFEVRHAPDDYRNFGDADPVHEELLAAPPLATCGIPRGIRTILVRAVNEVGAASEPAVLVMDRGPFDEALPVQVETEAEDPAFTGDIEGATLSGGELVADLEPRAWPADLLRPYWPQDLTATYWADMPATLRYTFVLDPSEEPADGRILTLDVGAAGRNWKVRYYVMDQPYWPENLLDPYWPADLDKLHWPALDLTAPHWEALTELFWPEDLTQPYWPSASRRWPGRLAHLPWHRVHVVVEIPGGQYPLPTLQRVRWQLSDPVSALPDDVPVLLAATDGDAAAGRVLAAGDGIALEDGGAGASLQVHGPPSTHLLVSEAIAVAGIPAADTEIQPSRLKVDLSRVTQVRVIVDIGTAAAGGGDVLVQYSLAGGANWDDLTGTTVALTATGVQVSSWAPIDAAAQGDRFLRVITRDGNESDTPVINRVALQVR